MQKLSRFSTTNVFQQRLLGVHSVITRNTQCSSTSASIFANSTFASKFNQQFVMLNSSVQSHSTRSSAKRSVGIVGMPNVGKSTLFNGMLF